MQSVKYRVYEIISPTIEHAPPGKKLLIESWEAPYPLPSPCLIEIPERERFRECQTVMMRICKDGALELYVVKGNLLPDYPQTGIA